MTKEHDVLGRGATRRSLRATTRSADFAVSLSNLSFAYDKKEILHIPGLKIRAGTHTLICGDSGCGKSTLLGLISGILTGYTGTLEVLGTELKTLKAARRDRYRAEKVAVIFQQFNLIPYLSVRENVLLGLKLAGKKVDAERLNSILSHLQIDDLAERPAVQLSHGQQQRAAAARAVMNSSPVILADEPTSALDDNNARLFLDLLFREADENKTTIIVVSHDVRYKKRFDTVIDLAHINRALKGRAA